MIPKSLITKLSHIQERTEEINHLLSQTETLSDQKTFQKLSKELAKITPITNHYEQYLNTQKELKNTKDALKNEPDAEIKDLFEEEIKTLNNTLKNQEKKLTFLLLPKDPDDEKNVFLEIRTGTGGEEAALFVADLMRMYIKYCENQKWQIKIINTQVSEQNGYKIVVLNIQGEQIYSKLKFESGTHRVQRIPATESQGRVHTSACTVAVLPEIQAAEEVEIDSKNIRIDTFRASGAGGQHVNKTDSAVRITYLPENIVVECQEERSQHKNKAKALALLSSKILSQRQAAIKASHDLSRKNLIGSGDRSEKIRTYNFPQSRITDHRIKLTLHQLNQILEGDLDLLLIPLMKEEQLQKLAELKNHNES